MNIAQRPMRPAIAAIATSAVFTALAGMPAWADEADTFNAALTSTVVRDNNLFRLADGVAGPAAADGNAARDDTIHAYGLGVTLDKTYSLQRFHVGANLADYRFRNFTYLDYQTKACDAYWNWSFSPDLSGKLIAERTQALNSFDDYRQFTRNVKTVDTRTATLAYGMTGNWQLFGGASRTRLGNDLFIPTTGEPTTRSAEAGLKYLAADGNSLTLLTRTARIAWADEALDPLFQTDVQANQHDAELQLYWRLTGKSLLRANVTRFARSHAHFASRDYDGTAGNLGYTWTPSGKTEVQFAAGRNYQSWWDITSSYMVTDNLTITPLWQPSAKTAVKLRFDRSRRNFYGPIIPLGAFGLPLRQDNVRSTQLIGNWLPLPNLSLSISLQEERRSSNIGNEAYRDSLTGLNLQLSY